MKKFMPLIWITVVLVICYFIFAGKFEFTNLQAGGLIFLMVVIIIIIGRNSYAENKGKSNFELHYIGFTMYIESILSACGLSSKQIKEYFEVSKKLEKGEKVKNEKLRPHGSRLGRILEKNDIAVTSRLTNGLGMNYSVINILDSGNYLMVDNDSKNIGQAFVTDISCLGRIDLIEGMKYTHIYICATGEGYEFGAINLDTEYDNFAGSQYENNWTGTVVLGLHPENRIVFGVAPYSIVHHHPFTKSQWKKNKKLLEKYNVSNDYELGFLGNEYFRFEYTSK